MPGSEYVIRYVSDYNNVLQGVRQVERVNADMSKTLQGDFQQAVRILGTSLDKVSETPIKIKGGEEATKTISQVGTVIQTANGQFKEFVKTNTFVDGQLIKTSGSLKDVTKQFVRTNIETEKGKKNFVSLSENMGRLASRALLTIPIWLALRGTITGTFRVLRDGLTTLADQDRAFQKAKRNLQGSASTIAQNFNTLRETVTRLSIESGESVETITKAFQKFATVGFDFETSLKGAEFALKTAVVLFGDAEETANAFARAMRVLVDRSLDAKPAGDQIAEAMALTAELWRTNAFELNEFTQSLEKFSGTAKATNFTARQTITLLSALSTAGLRGGRAGTLLRTSIVKLLQNLDKLSGTLGVKVNPQLDTTFTVFMRVLDAIQGLDEGSRVAKQTAEVLGDLFGGVRGIEAVLALKALRKELLENINTVGGIEQLNEAYQDVNSTISRLVMQIRNTNKELGKQFVQSLFGGAEKYLDLLLSISNYQKQLAEDTSAGISRLEALGASFNFLGKSVAFLPSLVLTLASLGKFKPVSPLDTLFDVEEIKIKRANQKINEFGDKIIAGLRGKLSKTDLIDLLTDFTLKLDENNIKLDDKALIQLEADLRVQLAKITDELPEVEIKTQQRVITTSERQEIAKSILDTELASLRVLGATNAQLLQTNELYSRQLGIEETSLDKLKRKLETEKAIREEKRLQNRLSSDSIRLFDIAQQEGVLTAQKIGDVLAGETDFATFVRRGGKELEIFKREFEDLFKQQQALAFFRGERVPGLANLRGGTRIPIEEQALRQPLLQFAPELALLQRKAEREFLRLEELNVRVDANVPIDVNIDIGNLEEVQQKFVDEVSKQLPQAGTKVNKALTQALSGNKQVPVL